MKIVYAGTPQFAVAPLKAILDAGWEVTGIVVQPDKPQGRKGILTPAPLKAFALERGLAVFQPRKLREELPALKGLGGDVMITCAYGQILSAETLELFPKGVWNLHASLLMKTAQGLDTGEILLSERTEIGGRETFGELSDRLSLLAATAVLKALPLIESGKFSLTAQREEGATLTKKIGKEQARIDFALPARRVVDLVRGMNPEPLAYTEADGLRLNVFRAESAPRPAGTEGAAAGEVLSDSPKAGLIVACGEGEAVRLDEVQAAGGKRMKGSDFLNGRKVKKGQVFSC